MDALMEALKDLILAGLTLAVTFAANAVRAWFEENKNNKKLQSINETIFANKEIVALAVDFAEQAFKGLNGPEKLEKAKDYAISVLQEKGLPVNEAEVDMLLEAAVKKMNDAMKK